MRSLSCVHGTIGVMADTQTSAALNETEVLHHSSLLNTLLLRRGITDSDAAEHFLNPSYRDHLHDPHELKGMNAAVERVLRAIDKNERILIYSDFDADGIPGAVVLNEFFRAIGFENFEHYIPHRHDEGFGVHLGAIEQFKDDGVDLVITIDCGIADSDEVARAREHGMDVIITDHHESNDNLPDATAIIDPKQEGCGYPFPDLCGAGVIFKLVQALLSARDFELPIGREKWMLDMVGLATLSDMVPLVGENRVLASYGLTVLRKSRRPGLMKMMRELGITQPRLTEDDIGFMISPRINAASRMGVPMDAFTFLSTRDHGEADRSVKHLNTINEERKGVVASMVKEIKKRLDGHERTSDTPVIVAGDPEWKPSLLGLAANTLAGELDRPVFLWGRDGKHELKGSARSNGRVDLTKLMEGAGDVLTQYGGHKLAGGFAVDHESVHRLEEALLQAAENVPEEPLDETDGEPDAELRLADVRDELFDEINRLAPFGVGNPKPLFRFRDVKIESARTFGKQNNHLELQLTTPDTRPVKAIAFFKTPQDFGRDLTQGKYITLTAHMERSFFRNRPELRLRIVNIE